MEPEIKLQRKLSPTNVLSLALGCIVGGSAFLMPSDIFLVNGGPLGTAIALGVAALIMVVIAYNYHYMINRFPLSGGEFIYSIKAFGRVHSLICTWFLGLSYVALVALNATALSVVGRNLLSNVFAVGFQYTVAGYDVYAGEIVLALAALILFAILAVRGVKCSGVLQTILVFVLVIGVLTISVVALISPDITLANLEPAYYPKKGTIAGILAVLAVSPWAFVGFDTVPQSAEEFHFSHRETKQIMVVAIVSGALVYILINTVTAICVPENYATWVDYIDDAKNLKGLMGVPTFYAAYQLLGWLGVSIFGFAATAAILTGIIGFYMASSRLLYAISLERIIPEWFGKLDAKYKTPRNAILFVLLVSCVGPFFGRTALGWIVDMSAIGAAIGFGYTSAATLYYANKEKGSILYKVTGTLGVIFSTIFTVLLLVPIDLFNCSLGKEAWICLIVWIVLGIFFYAYSSRKFN